jgi:hypothetical protein
MDSALNPYAPGSGRRPPALTGRDAELKAVDTMVRRAQRKLSSRGMVLYGLRGVGKTVLLGRMREAAEKAGWFTVHVEAQATETGQEAIRQRLGRALVNQAYKHSKKSPAKRLANALKSISSFSATVGVSGVSLGIETNPARANSGQIEIDLEEMVEDVCDALAADGTAFALFIDEMQYIDRELLSALLTVQHLAGQRDWPFYIIGAGLPNLPAALATANSYAERLFEYREIGPLDHDAASTALSLPAREMGAEFTPEALDRIIEAADGFPYFLQEFGQAIWDIAPASPFTLDDARLAIETGVAQLDLGFFPSRWDRASRGERRYLTAMAADGAAGSNTGEIADRLGYKLASIGPTRAQLIAKGLIYAPEHGRVAFTVPGMAAFIRRQHGDE